MPLQHDGMMSDSKNTQSLPDLRAIFEYLKRFEDTTDGFRDGLGLAVELATFLRPLLSTYFDPSSCVLKTFEGLSV